MRIHLPSGPASLLLQEFTQLFCVEKSLGVAAIQFERIFGQKLSVDMLETINPKMREQAENYIYDYLSTTTAKEEGELLVATAAGKGVPLVKDDATRVPAFDKRSVRAIVAWRRWGVCIR